MSASTSKISSQASNQPVRRWLFVILAIYLFLSLSYGILNPLFEAPDEHNHFFTAQFVSETGNLPFIGLEPDRWLGQEAAQPPLYYVLAAILINPIETNMAWELTWPNPRVQLGDASSPTNTNAFVHTSAEDWPWQGHVLAGHLLRAFSAVMGLGTLLCIYGGARLIWPAKARRALLATAMVAFLPQFTFLHGTASNDPLVIFLVTFVLWQLLRLWYAAITPGHLLLLGLTVGLAILTKMVGLLLLFYAIGFVLVVTLRDSQNKNKRDWTKSWLYRVTLIVIPALLLSGWLLWRNWSLYGDITASNQFVSIAGGNRAYSVFQVLAEMDGLWVSLFAVFGWFNIRAPQWVYFIWNGIVLAAIVGAFLPFISLVRSRPAGAKFRARLHGILSQDTLNKPATPALLLAAWVILVYAGLFMFLLQTPAAQGRLLFPAILPLALGLAYGLSQYRWSGVYVIVPLLALTTSVFSLITVIPAAYKPPPILAASEIPFEAVLLEYELGQGIELVAAEVHTDIANPDEWIWATLYWQKTTKSSDTEPGESPEYVLELYGHDNALVGKLQSYHGGGLFPATLWIPDELVADRLAVKLDERLDTPTQVRLNVKIVGESESVDVGTVKVIPEQWPAASESNLALLDGIRLTSVEWDSQVVQPGEILPLQLRWEVDEAPGRDLTTFVHLGDPSQPPVAQGDSPPLGGDYPTGLWSDGEVIDDEYSLVIPADLPAGRYSVHLGLYDPVSGARLPLTIDGERQSNDAYLVGWLAVTER